MKILVVVDTMGTGGKERRLLELLKGLVKYDHLQCELVILSDIIEYLELKQLDLKIHSVKRNAKVDLSVYQKLYAIARDFEPDIIQSWSSLVSLYVFPIAKLLRIKFVNAMIADAPKDLKVFSSRWVRSRLSFPFSDAIVANSQAGITAYSAPKHKSHCIPNGIDLKRFSTLDDKMNIRKKFGIKTKFVVGMVGSFRGAKDYGVYIEAARQILSQRKDISFLAIGEGKDLPIYQASIEKELQDYIIFPGRQEDIESIVNVFNIGVLITDNRVHGEGISNAIIEYMVLGKAVIATDTGGTTELLIDGETGIITPQRDPHTLADNILYLIDHPEIAHQMGKAGQERISENFSLSKMTHSFVKLYESMLQGSPKASV